MFLRFIFFDFLTIVPHSYTNFMRKIVRIILIGCFFCYQAIGELPTYLSEMGPFEMAKRIKYLASRYNISMTNVQILDAVFEKTGQAWEEYGKGDIAAFAEELDRRYGKTTNNDAAKQQAERDAEQRIAELQRNMESQRNMEAYEKREAAARVVRLKLEAEAKAKAKNEAEIDLRSLQWQQRQASNGLASGQCSLGIRYGTGTGVEKDQGLAVYWLTLSAAQGNIEAKAALVKLTNTPPN
ncbi:MAG: hypothetical protein WCO56_22380 [Verrucomicrobiota bacterium]